LADLPELRGLADDELSRRASEVREELFRLRMQHATLQLDDTSRLAQVRREIAQILTVRRARELTPEAASVDEG
jgi:large subunit ribosomal protein L29